LIALLASHAKASEVYSVDFVAAVVADAEHLLQHQHLVDAKQLLSQHQSQIAVAMARFPEARTDTNVTEPQDTKSISVQA